jgi:hypothetical protein
VLQAVGVWEEARETDALHAIDASLYDMAIGAYRKQGAFDKVGRPILSTGNFIRYFFAD